jgi:hypothetical protein
MDDGITFAKYYGGRRGRDNVVGIATAYGLDNHGVGV